MLPYVFRSNRFLCLRLFWAALAVQLSWKNVWKGFESENGVFLVLVSSFRVCLGQMLLKVLSFLPVNSQPCFTYINNLKWTFRFKMRGLICHCCDPSRLLLGKRWGSREEVWARFSSSNKFLISAPTCSPVAPQPASCLQPELVMLF